MEIGLESQKPYQLYQFLEDCLCCVIFALMVEDDTGFGL